MVFILPTPLRYLLALITARKMGWDSMTVPRAHKADIGPAQVGAGGVKELCD